VIVATRNRPAHAAQVVRDVIAQGMEGCEILVIDQSDPVFREELRATIEARARLICAPRDGLPAARNLGLEQSTGQVVIFFDDDVRLHPGCVAAHLAAYDDPWVGGVVGRIDERVVRPNATGTRNEVDWMGRVRTNLEGRVPGEVQTTKGANMSFRRVALRGVGPADTGYAGTAFLEDADWSTRVRRLGWRLRFEPRASVEHLSAPAGGCRVEGAQDALWWRFRNTGYFIRRHRAPTAPLAFAAFVGLALRHAVREGGPARAQELVGAWVQGWQEAGTGRG
jgi:GT2 family glycosyltransferase